MNAIPWNIAMRPKALVSRSRPSSSTKIIGRSEVHAPVRSKISKSGEKPWSINLANLDLYRVNGIPA